MQRNRKVYIAIAIPVGVVILAIVLILPHSFPTVEYYQYGFKQRKSTGWVDVSRVYKGGRYGVGPDTTFKVFPANAQNVTFKRATVFTSKRLEVRITCVLQYFLRPHQLALLHEKYDLHYESVMEDSALDAMKGAATAFSTDEFIWSRNEVEEALFKAIRERLGGNCCEKDCENIGKCQPGCKEYTQCVEADWGLFAEVRYFQLGRLDIPTAISGRFTRALILPAQAEVERYRQKGKVIRKNTQKEVENVDNEREEILQNATAQAEAVKIKAAAEAAAIVEEARFKGLQLLYTEVGITDQKHKASFDYIRALKSHKNARITVNYQEMIAGKI